MTKMLRASFIAGGVGIVLGIFGTMSITDKLDQIQLIKDSPREATLDDLAGGVAAISVGAFFILVAVVLLLIGISRRKKNTQIP